jgi:hypothetical protein
MTIIRSVLFAALATLFVAFAASAPAPAAAQTGVNTSAAGQYTGWVQWGGEGRIEGVTWTLSANGRMSIGNGSAEYGYWMQYGDYVEFLYFCSGEYLCHYRGRLYNGVISGAATSNQGHTATFEMRLRR